MGRGWFVLVLVAVLLAAKHRPTWIGLFLVPVAALVLFVPKYVEHDYYLIAVSPALAALLALGIASLVGWLGARPSSIPSTLAMVTAVWLASTLWLSHSYWGQAYEPPRGAPPESIEIKGMTSPDDLVMVGGFGRDPRILYYAERKGLMLVEPRITREMVEAQTPEQYSALYSASRRSHVVDWASMRPWYSPATANTLLLGSSPEELGESGLAASVHAFEAAIDGGSASIISETTIICDESDSVTIPSGEGAIWLSVRSEGAARAVMRPGLIPVPAESLTLVYSPPAGEAARSREVLTCLSNQGGSLSIVAGVEVPASR